MQNLLVTMNKRIDAAFRKISEPYFCDFVWRNYPFQRELTVRAKQQRNHKIISHNSSYSFTHFTLNLTKFYIEVFK